MKTRSLFSLIVILIFAISLSAQTDKKLSYGLYFTPKTSFVLFDDIELGENQNKLGFNVQAAIHYHLNGKITFSSGIKYRWDRSDNIDYSATLGCDHDGNGGVLIFNSWYEDQLDAHYVGIPIEYRNVIVEKASKLYVKFGYEFLFNIKTEQTSILVECGTNEVLLTNNAVTNVAKTTSRLTLGFGLEIPSSGKSRFIIEPEIAYSLSPIYEDVGVFNSSNNIRFFDVGIKFGVSL